MVAIGSRASISIAKNDIKTVERPGGLFCVDNCCFITHVLRFEKQKTSGSSIRFRLKRCIGKSASFGGIMSGFFYPGGNQLFKDLQFCKDTG
jgi:hypothetical protein